VVLAYLGFFFLPTTTMGYAVAQNEFHGVEGWGLVVVILGVMIDFGLLGGGGRASGGASTTRLHARPIAGSCHVSVS
jgi:hypothetical protein